MTVKKWITQEGVEIPANRVTRAEKLKEKRAERLLNGALKINKQLVLFRETIEQNVDEVMAAVIAENDGRVPDNFIGNFSFKTFDGRIKVELNIQSKIEFDDALIMVAKQHLEKFIENSQTGIDELIQEITLNAFQTVKGRLDTKRVLNLVSYRQRVDKKKYPDFHAAIDAIERATNKTYTKKYYRIYERNNDGEYQSINLNFSAL